MNSSSDTVSGQAGEQLQRPTSLLAKLSALGAGLQAQADNAYIAYLALCKKDAVLGWEIKVKRGHFGQAEISAHKAAAEMLGRHRALQEVANRVDQLLKKAAK